MSTAIAFPDEPELSPTEALRLEARRIRATASPSTETGIAPDPYALEGLPTALRPFNRSLATRRGRPRTKKQEVWSLRHTTRIVTESGLVPADWPTDPELFPWHCLDEGQVASIYDLMHAKYPHPGSANNRLGEVRRMLKLCAKAKLMTRAQLEDLLDLLPVPKAHTRRPGRALTGAELSALIAAADQNVCEFMRLRDGALIATLACTGARAGELADVQFQDWDRANATLFFQTTKNGCSHTVYLHPTATLLLDRWVALRGTAPGPLFLSHSHWRSMPAGIDYDIILSRVRTIADIAGVSRIGTHDFRRSVATILLRTTDIPTVALILNHKDINSTAAYDRSGDELARAAVNSLPLPEIGGTEPEGPQ